MATTVKVRRVGNSLGLILPQELVNKLAVGEGDLLTVVETNKGVELIPQDPEFEQWMTVYKEVNQRYRNAFKKLAQ
ncbi:AbrB/MazE/SpoVT family DNA-binding domain-containing protein [Aetokthonos hydrillicola Thurmond2011]|jgi:putative addiction module antidote|uniref:AbrB/MazE/SpoVT family DNA-binding domain-containing protein n=1 Tax=Aetokthonos hydrillicola Thurmond2011 TaxID=2712845 RepID=A0AAP5I4W7_9CYAN|nr:AbrB/MazE/SpoVT family DNA-binding domain-containing protein [Aetokthonos hydrillicola]MBO3459812.1 AbrB/MazE/SpoVT family DNA-binding domain-containing protein [Aetokthonos hydrillicola CCALA 1050]MBW4584543.1 AbrB/MazE/SpoVT family DNA-binding domain-containing protein [Aetokthonos hydrillicola CCALA 1050]MDR9895087.1 AbrB/MazE/SpoVT family DNA-binding domain-containing protein [Aetokthonos hydrillicola Thurmond2011]